MYKKFQFPPENMHKYFENMQKIFLKMCRKYAYIFQKYSKNLYKYSENIPKYVAYSGLITSITDPIRLYNLLISSPAGLCKCKHLLKPDNSNG